MKCATHPDVETNLRCATCGKPICPRCMVETPVGMKCRECARLQRPPMFRVSPKHYLRAAGAGLGSAFVFGLAWAIFRALIPFAGFFSFIIGGAVGYGIGEVVFRSSGRKRGTGIATIAGGSVVLCYLLGLWLFAPILSAFGLFGFGFGFFDLVAVAIGVFVAVREIR